MTTLAITPASGAITATKTVCRVEVAGADANDLTDYDAAKYPSAAEFRYYLTFEKGGEVLGKSYVFGPNGGAHIFNNYIFPSAGSWTVRISNAATDGSVATLAVTVA
jgi:hypothetical protein